MGVLRFILVLTGAACVHAAAAGADGPPVPGQIERWSRIVGPDRQMLGRLRETTVARGDGERLSAEMDLLFTVGGHDPMRLKTRNSRDVDARGQTIALAYESLEGRNRTALLVRLTGQAADIQRKSNAGERRWQLDVPADLRFDDGAGLVRAGMWGSDNQIAFHRFDPASASIEKVVLERAGEEIWQGQRVTKIIRRSSDGADLRSISSLLVDDKGEAVRRSQFLLGTWAFVEPVQGTLTDATLQGHVIPHQMTPSLNRISKPARAGHIRYKFGFVDGMRFSLPSDGQQRMARDGENDSENDGGTVIVDVCENCGPGLSMAPDMLARWTQPTSWLESDHPDLRRVALPVAAMKITGERKMALLARAARGRLSKVDYHGHASALAAWRQRSGDCTEDAVVLAALGRAAGIPTRVANGLVYSREAYHGVSNAFMPHSWTLAYVDGAWRSFDMSLDGFDATHIALTVGDGDARSIATANQLATLLIWREMAEVRSRPTH